VSRRCGFWGSDVGEGYTNTEFERLALDNLINLSDGHARHTLSDAQRKIIQSSPVLFDDALSRRQQDIEREFLDWFLRCANQGQGAGTTRAFFSYSASSAIAMAAQFCSLTVTDFLDEITFVEIGLNDLTQYTMAWDRNVVNPRFLPSDEIASAVSAHGASSTP